MAPSRRPCRFCPFVEILPRTGTPRLAPRMTGRGPCAEKYSLMRFLWQALPAKQHKKSAPGRRALFFVGVAFMAAPVYNLNRACPASVLWAVRRPAPPRANAPCSCGRRAKCPPLFSARPRRRPPLSHSKFQFPPCCRRRLWFGTRSTSPRRFISALVAQQRAEGYSLRV